MRTRRPFRDGAGSFGWVPGVPIRPPVNTMRVPQRPGLRRANSRAMHAPCEKPTTAKRSGGRRPFSLASSRASSQQPTASVRKGSLAWMGSQNRLGYQLPTSLPGTIQRTPFRWPRRAARSTLPCGPMPRPWSRTPAKGAAPRGWPTSCNITSRLLGCVSSNEDGLPAGCARRSVARGGGHGSYDFRRGQGLVGFRHGDGLQHGYDFGATFFEPGWEQQAGSQLFHGLVAGEGSGRGGGALHQNSSWAAAVDGVEVISILDLRTVGIAELLVDSLLLGQLFVALEIHGDVVGRAGSEGPASGRAVGFVYQGDGLGRSTRAYFKTMIIDVDSGFAEAEGVDEETLGLGDFTDRKNGAVETSRRDIRGNFFGGPALAFVVVVFDHFKLQTGGMAEAEEGLAETLLLATMRDFVAIQMLNPELDGSLRNRVSGGFDLAGTWTAWNALIREGGVHRAGLAVRVGIIQVIVSIAAVKEDGLLDQPLAEHLR